MSGESRGPLERSHNIEEAKYDTEAEQRYAQLLAAEQEANAVIDVLGELDERFIPGNIKRRLVDVLRQLEQIGRDGVTPALSEERKQEIERSHQSRERVDSELEEARASIQKSVELSEIERQFNLMNASWNEAFNRLPPDSDIASFTGTRSIDEVQKHLTEHQSELTPEEVFFLQTTIEVRKAGEAYRKAKGIE